MTRAEYLDSVDRAFIQNALVAHDGHVVNAAAAIDVNRTHMHKLIRQYKLNAIRPPVRTANLLASWK